MNALKTFRMRELQRDYMGEALQSKALQRLLPDWIAADRNGDSHLSAAVDSHRGFTAD